MELGKQIGEFARLEHVRLLAGCENIYGKRGWSLTCTGIPNNGHLIILTQPGFKPTRTVLDRHNPSVIHLIGDDRLTSLSNKMVEVDGVGNLLVRNSDYPRLYNQRGEYQTHVKHYYAAAYTKDNEKLQFITITNGHSFDYQTQVVSLDPNSEFVNKIINTLKLPYEKSPIYDFADSMVFLFLLHLLDDGRRSYSYPGKEKEYIDKKLI